MYCSKRIASVGTRKIIVANIIRVKNTFFGVAFTAIIMPVISAATIEGNS
jgi:hypothetical protein